MLVSLIHYVYWNSVFTIHITFITLHDIRFLLSTLDVYIRSYSVKSTIVYYSHVIKHLSNDVFEHVQNQQMAFHKATYSSTQTRVVHFELNVYLTYGC